MPASEMLFPAGSLVLLVGPPASGKSTLARALVAAGVIDRHAVVSADDFRELLTGSAGELDHDRRVFRVIRMTLHERLSQGATVVLDATNLWASRRRKHIAVAAEYGRPVTAIRFEVALKELLERNARRTRQVPPGAIVLMSRQLAKGATAEHLRDEGCVQVLDADSVLAAVGA